MGAGPRELWPGGATQERILSLEEPGQADRPAGVQPAQGGACALPGKPFPPSRTQAPPLRGQRGALAGTLQAPWAPLPSVVEETAQLKGSRGTQTDPWQPRERAGWRPPARRPRARAGSRADHETRQDGRVAARDTLGTQEGTGPGRGATCGRRALTPQAAPPAPS